MSDSSRLHASIAFAAGRHATTAVGAGVVRGGLREESSAASTPAASGATATHPRPRLRP